MEEKNQAQTEEKNQTQIGKKIDVWPMVAIAIIAFLAGMLIYSELIKLKSENWFVSEPFIKRPISSTPSSVESSKSDTSRSILNDVDKIQLENLDQQFQEIDQELNRL